MGRAGHTPGRSFGQGARAPARTVFPVGQQWDYVFPLGCSSWAAFVGGNEPGKGRSLCVSLEVPKFIHL